MAASGWVRRVARGVSVVGIFLLIFSAVALGAVGRTPGSAQVSASGTAQYSVPIWAPPGAGGMRPNLAVVYNHTQDNGLLGMGFDLAGLSSLSRCMKTIAQDGSDAGILMQTSDAYCLDGNRLRYISGTYGQGGSIYQTELETFVKVTANGTVGGGPDWFEVRHPNGLIAEYGHSSDSRIDFGGSTAREWAMTSIRDPAGNRIDFTYTEDAVNGSYRPNTINYAINSTAGVSTAPYQVALVYETASRPDPIHGNFPAGGARNEVKRLEKIEIRYYVSGSYSPVKIYKFEYESAGGAGGRSRLEYLRECSTSTSECLSPTEFNWTSTTSGLQTEQNPSQTSPTPVHFIDVDADGRDDMVYSSHATAGSGTWRIRKGNASSGFDSEINTSVSNVGYGSALPLDWEGDGDIDLLVNYASNQWHVLVSNGSTFAAPSNTGISASGSFNTIDMDGDSREDLVRIDYGPPASLKVRYRSGSSFGTEQTLWTTSSSMSFAQGFQSSYYRYRSRTRRADFNADGIEEFHCWLQDFDVESGSTTLHSAICSKYGFVSLEASVDGSNDLGGMHTYGDFNDDGLTDMFWPRISGGGSAVYFGGSTTPITGPSMASAWGFAVLDHDADGRDDVLAGQGSGTTNLNYYRGTGSGLASAVATSYSYAQFTQFHVGEIDGDGNIDLVTLSGSTLKHRLRNPVPADLLASAVDGFGVSHAFTYASMADTSVYTKGTGATYPIKDVKSARPLAKVLTQSDGTGTGSTFTLTYSYEGARTDQSGRGYLGFSKRTVIDSRGGYNVKTEETWRQDWPFIGLPSATSVKQSGGTLITDQAISWAALTYSSGFDTRKYPYAYSTTQTDRELNGTTFRTTTRVLPGTNGIDGIDGTSGMIKDVTTTITEVGSTGKYPADAKTSRVEHEVFNDPTNWCLGQPDRTEVTNDLTISGIAAETRTVDRTWSGLYCRVTSEVTEPDISQWLVTTAYDYDDFGNVDNQTVTGASMSARTTTLSWGTQGQFPVSATNALTQTVSQGFRYDLGLQTSITDPNGLATSWTYDNFGRRTLETRPDGTKTAWELYAYTSDTPRSRYYVKELWQQTGGTAIREKQIYFDQFDRPYLHLGQVPTTGGYSWQTTRAEFDARGRAITRYTPYFWGGSADGYWAFEYDVLNRTTAEKLYAAGPSLNRSQTHAYNGLATTTTDFKTNQTTRYVAAWGDLAQIDDAGTGQTKYKHDGFGQILEVKDAYNNVTSSIAYNVRGMKVSMTDLDMGFWEYLPNALGEVTKVRDAKTSSPNWTTEFTFDALSRPLTRVESEGTTTWTWGTSAGSYNIGYLASVSGPGYSESLTYDNKARLSQRSITTDAAYLIDYSYSSTTGLLDTLTYPTSTSSYRFKLQYEYAYGLLSKVKRFDSPYTEYWKLNDLDEYGNVVNEDLGNGIQVVSGFDPLTGQLLSRESGPTSTPTSIQNLTYEWDLNGNLKKRVDERQSNLTEDFYHDSLNRLYNSKLNSTTNLDVTYDLIGNITTKSDVPGTWTYHSTKKHAVTSAGGGTYTYTYDANGNAITKNGNTISWTSFNMPSSISGGGSVSSQFWYGPGRQRFKHVANFASGSETTHYVGGILEKVVIGSTTHYKHFISGPTGAVATYTRRSNSTEDTFYFTKDHQGSIDSIANASGTVQVRLSSKAFGERRKEAGWSGAVPSADWTAIGNTTRRAYTGHEMVDNLNLIHMNGRVQDPVIGRFLSADQNVPSPALSQSFNRYSYVRNNPLTRWDPSGFKDNDIDVKIQYEDVRSADYVDTQGTLEDPHQILIPAQPDTSREQASPQGLPSGPLDNSVTSSSLPGSSDGGGVGGASQIADLGALQVEAEKDKKCTLTDLASDVWNSIKEQLLYKHVLQHDTSIEIIWGSQLDGFSRRGVSGGFNTLGQLVVTFDFADDLQGSGLIAAADFGRDFSYGSGPVSSGHQEVNYAGAFGAIADLGLSGAVSWTDGSASGSLPDESSSATASRVRAMPGRSMGLGLAFPSGTAQQQTAATPPLISPPKFSGKCGGR